jgi:hypothetical protein
MDKNSITIEGQIATWAMTPTQGSTTSTTYSGTFQFRCILDPIRTLQAGREYRELLGKNAILAEDNDVDLAWALTQLKHKVVKAPPFWSSTLQDSDFAGNLPDLNIIAMAMEASSVAEQIYKEKMGEEKEAILKRTIKVAEQKVKKSKE